MSDEQAAIDELKTRLQEISDVIAKHQGVNYAEHLLVDLLRFLKEGKIGRPDAEAVLVDLMKSWPDGAVETIEFLMHDLRWNTVREALEAQVNSAHDFRHRDQARSALEAFEDPWEAGGVYETYCTGKD